MLSLVGNVMWRLLWLCFTHFLIFVTVSKASPIQRSFAVPQPRQALVLQDKPVQEDPIIEINKNILRSLTPDQSFLIDGDIIFSSSRSAVADDLLKWPKSEDGYVRVPYAIADYPAEYLGKFEEAFQDFHKYTCVRFVPMKDESDFISIHQLNGCYSNVGRKGGMQLVSLDVKCMQSGKGTIIHEFIHALGFWHEQARSDRDRFVTISWANIWTGFENNFMLVGDSRNFVDYDYSSIMHYSKRAFSKDGKDTIVPIQNAEIGQRIGMSPLDIKKINLLYQCAPGKYQPLSVDSEHMMDVQTPNPVSPSKPVLSTTTSKTAVLSPAGLQKLRRTLESFSCDFESGLCGWTLSGDTLNWTLHSGSVLSVGTGPSHDFTLGHCNASREGNYLYLEATYPNKTAVLISPMLRGPQCLSFMYHMYGQNMGSIAVYKRLNNSTEPEELLWSEKGNKGTLWLYGSVNITAQDSTRYQLLFKGTTGSGYSSDAALDDIHIQKECYTYNEMMICAAAMPS
ncbi:astacin-like metalloendopeptidase [Acipenser ruthenus]|uniref:astacin-like metalloendopeptidase n=1 Tax=Acipenser ruthenus TaxID=7906 RepID=UPI0027421DCE|nr:astacin-like metalloendopeptidase [Acipenser ruthenus]